MNNTVLVLLMLMSITRLMAQDTTPPLVPISFSMAGGFYDTTFQVTLFHSEEAKIFYTLDGNQPSSRATRYRGPITIDTNTIVRAIAFTGTDRSAVYSQSYLFNVPESTFPTLSIAIDPWRLFDSESGLFMLGSKANLETSRLSGANFWSRKELPAHLEYFTAEGKSVFNSALGFRLFGGISRLFPQKSMALITRSSYGAKNIDYP
ncbi:MAG: chitobiase/beta-hexosaminidase C-terminal domain-containing protein, partial [Bacteroidota bacterium]